MLRHGDFNGVVSVSCFVIPVAIGWDYKLVNLVLVVISIYFFSYNSKKAM